MNVYQVDTIVQLNVTFYNVALNLPADPTAVALFTEAPDGTVSQVPANQIVRTGTGTYYCDFLPNGPGLWKYKWQGSGSTVVATSRDTPFFVQASQLISA